LEPSFQQLRRGSSGRSLRAWLVPGIIAGSLILLLVLAILRPGPMWHRSLPDFSRIDDRDERKAAFFGFLDPYIEEANADLLAKRRRLHGIQRLHRSGSLNCRDRRWIQQIAAEVGIEVADGELPSAAQLEAVDLRLDIIPPSLALAQAALESGWGTSRFAREGNNLFGMWCYVPGCGIVPKRRPAGATYEVTKYRSPRESFAAYIRNLNSNTAYASLWALRKDARMAGEPLQGLVLADGLYRYSEEGWLYIDKVKGVIRGNQLHQLD
jgi:Bax protein